MKLMVHKNCDATISPRMILMIHDATDRARPGSIVAASTTRISSPITNRIVGGSMPLNRYVTTMNAW
ncbi:MAG: hypothetical protein R3C45_19665 [Phycisphaerales bacterium]